MSYVESVIERYDDTPFTAWFDHYSEGQIHLGFWPKDRQNQTFAEAATQLTGLLIEKLDVNKDQRVLDAGCGVYAGPAIQLAKEKGCEVTGVTLEERAEQIVPERAASKGVGEKVRVHSGNAEQLPFNDESFDRAWIIEMLIHIPDKAAVLREVNRVLKPGAKLVIADFPAGENFTPDNEWVRDNFFKPSGFADFNQLLNDIGFEVLSAEDYNETVAIPTFQKMLKYTRENPVETKDVVGDEMYQIIEQSVPAGINAHKNRVLTYGIIEARKT
jgi:cyclopropane fatty-acyl-phospholipid synthase-like methyltransferase